MPSSLDFLFLARWRAVCYDEQRIWKLSMQNEQPIQKKKTARATASMAVMKDQFHSFFFTILFFSSFGVGISPDTDCRGARSTW